jgi:hypothetical protein
MIRIHGACWRAQMVVLALMATTFASLGVPARADAATYEWVDDTDGRHGWDDGNNWRCIPATAPCGAFPNRVGDIAVFRDLNSNIQVDIRVPITLGKLSVTGSRFVNLQGFNDGLLIFDNGALNGGGQQPTEISCSPGVPGSGRDNFLRIGLVTQVNGPLTIAADNAPGMEILDPIFGAHDIVTRGTARIDSLGASGHIGRTTIERGTLRLGSQFHRDGTSIVSAIVVGTDVAGGPAANLVVEDPNEIGDTVPVFVLRTGTATFLAEETIGDLAVEVGRVESAQPLHVRDLTLRSGTVDVGQLVSVRGRIVSFGQSVITGPPTRTLRFETPAAGDITIADGRLQISNHTLEGAPDVALIKRGPGALQFLGTTQRQYGGPTLVFDGTLTLSGTGLFPGTITAGGLQSAARLNVEGASLSPQTTLVVRAQATASIDTAATVGLVEVVEGTLRLADNQFGAPSTLTTPLIRLSGGTVALETAARLFVGRIESVESPAESTIAGPGAVAMNGFVPVPMLIEDGAPASDLVIASAIIGPQQRFIKTGAGTLSTIQNHQSQSLVSIAQGTLLLNGAVPEWTVELNGGTFAGEAEVGEVRRGTGGRVAPQGLPHAELRAKSWLLGAQTTVDLRLTRVNEIEHLRASERVVLTGATLTVTRAGELPAGASFRIVDNAGAEAVTGTFDGLAEGAVINVQGIPLTISYRGGDGNDVVLSAPAPPAPGPEPTPGPGPDPGPTPGPDPGPGPDPNPDPGPDPNPAPGPDPGPAPADVIYDLSEGATGTFFDEDVLIANPNTAEAPVTITFAKSDGTQVEVRRTLAPQSRLTLRVDDIAGLEHAAASARVRSDNRMPLFVERTMFFDARGYGGHTGTAIATPSRDWYFAEGSEGFFKTFVLVINPNPTPVDVTFSFLFENRPAVQRTVTVGPSTRFTLNGGDVPEIKDTTFGIAVHATQPIGTERAMYFGDAPNRLFSGAHESAGVTTPSAHWFLAEGATGSFFDTYVLLSNPNPEPAEVSLKFLLTTGEVVDSRRTVPAHGRATVDIEHDGDRRLTDAEMSTVVTSDRPIIAERSMYWPGAAEPWGEGHNSFGVVNASTRWGLAEGRLGGPQQFHTYILLANPSSTAAEVEVTFLRENGAPVLRTYTVAPTSRFTLDTLNVPELLGARFGALIDVKNNVPIIVERSLYWDFETYRWSGGTNVTGIPVPHN